MQDTSVSEVRHAFTLSVPVSNLERLEIWTLVCVLIGLQVFDGILTFWGVQVFGLDIEANPLLKFLMSNWGVGFALFSMKSFAVLAAVLLYFSEIKHSVLKNGLWSLNAFYILCAVLPWSIVFLSYNLAPYLIQSVALFS
ncbi:MAG: DUF5658 family protein [Deltaproteobacteria bacterium]|nr:DUF5658 family protein [Deltaproteobacteria bacterium]MCX7953232.1 DUF5658 family protein [Deltaproteobacteria bacterium]